MSLKDFHKIFIVASIILCIFFGVWAWNQYNTHNTLGLFITAVCSFLLAIGLIIYGIYFLKKTRVM